MRHAVSLYHLTPSFYPTNVSGDKDRLLENEVTESILGPFYNGRSGRPFVQFTTVHELLLRQRREHLHNRRDTMGEMTDVYESPVLPGSLSHASMLQGIPRMPALTLSSSRPHTPRAAPVIRPATVICTRWTSSPCAVPRFVMPCTAPSRANFPVSRLCVSTSGHGMLRKSLHRHQAVSEPMPRQPRRGRRRSPQRAPSIDA